MADQPPGTTNLDDLASEFGHAFEELDAAPIAEDPPPDFDERRYIQAFPDVALAIESGEYSSARQHYMRYGQAEGRLDWLDYKHAWPIRNSASFPAHGIDAVFRSPAGRVLVIGWVDDAAFPLLSLSLTGHESLLAATSAIARCRREDAERATAAPPGRLLGLWSVLETAPNARIKDTSIVLMTATQQRSEPVTVQAVSEERLRELAFEYFAHASYYGNPQVEAADYLDTGLGRALIAANAEISAQFVQGAFCRRFGPARSRFAGSIVVCLYGRPEYMFLQAAFFTQGRGWEEYEFIYVSNSPELAETLLKEAAIAAQIYGLNITLVILAGNAGFGAANNVAVGFAQSDRILITNPDVFPRNDDWATRHSLLIDTLPDHQSRLFGAPLFYDDGSLMHGGMFFQIDEGFSILTSGIKRRDLVRVEHYGKGAPPGTARFFRSRPVPAVTGAFMSIARDWYEELDGFSPEYVFGHYEDADLCLKSLSHGTEVWMHDLPLWHLEGKGSSRRSVHEGGSMVNRWHFTQLWGDVLRDGLLGPDPTRLAADTADQPRLHRP